MTSQGLFLWPKVLANKPTLFLRSGYWPHKEAGPEEHAAASWSVRSSGVEAAVGVGNVVVNVDAQACCARPTKPINLAKQTAAVQAELLKQRPGGIWGV